MGLHHVLEGGPPGNLGTKRCISYDNVEDDATLLIQFVLYAWNNANNIKLFLKSRMPGGSVG